jgi:hypothetical protein
MLQLPLMVVVVVVVAGLWWRQWWCWLLLLLLADCVYAGDDAVQPGLLHSAAGPHHICTACCQM